MSSRERFSRSTISQRDPWSAEADGFIPPSLLIILSFLFFFLFRIDDSERLGGSERRFEDADEFGKVEMKLNGETR